MPQRICSKKAPLLKSHVKRIPKKNLKFSPNCSNNTLGSLKLSTPTNNISKVKQSASAGGKLKEPSGKIRNTEYGKCEVAQHPTRQNDVYASEMHGNDTFGNSSGE